MDIPDTFWVGVVFASTVWSLCLFVFALGVRFRGD